MPTSEELTDTYLAALLARDAENASNGVVTGRQKPVSMPKPNMRFLKNILRETDNHNAALLAKTDSKRSHSDVRKRSLKRQRVERPGRWSAALGEVGPKRERTERRLDRVDQDTRPHRDRDRSEERSSKHRRSEKTSSSSHTLDEETDSREHRRHRHYRRRSSSSEDDRHESSSSRKHRKSYDDHKRSSSQTYDDRTSSSRRRDRRSSRHRASRSRSRSPNSRQRRHNRHGDERTRPLPRRQIEETTSRSDQRARQEDSDSDPLDAMLGPLPADIAPRGRGTNAARSGIDARFQDRAHNVSQIDGDDVEDSDWEQALSAARDRAKWRSIGADRLRAAGFTDTEVKSWEKTLDLTGTSASGSGDKDKSADDVVWNKRGEARQWDLGKTVAADGSIQVKAAWSADA